MTATQNLPGYPSLAMTNIMTILPKCFSARWLVTAVIQNRDTRFPTEVESEFGILK